MKRIICLAAAIVACCSIVSAQNTTAEALVEDLKTSSISLDYSWFSGKTAGSGSVTVQDDCFHAIGNGLETWCDGTTRWTVDKAGKEVVIEDCSGTNEYVYMLNNVTEFKPSGNSFEGTMKRSGQTVRFKLSSIKKKAKTEDLSAFRFNTGTLDKSWVITDLR